MKSVQILVVVMHVSNLIYQSKLIIEIVLFFHQLSLIYFYYYYYL